VRKIDEKKGERTYSVAYACDGNLIKVVRINEGVLTSAANTVQLQIQRIGIEPKIEWLEFKDGIAETYYEHLLDYSSTSPFLHNDPPHLEMILRKFASEFEEVLQEPNILPYFQTHLGDLRPYLR
jgi:hypothetical protein